MKILMINVTCGTGSTGRICTDLANALERKGHKVRIAYGREPVPEQFKRYAVRVGTDRDVQLHGIKARAFDAMGQGSRSATQRFVEWIREYDPDVIHLHNLHGYYLNIEVLFSYLKTCGKKLIWTLHDCWSFTGHCAYFDYANCEKWKTGCSACPEKGKYPKSFFLDRSKKNYALKKELFTGLSDMTLVVPSNWLKALVSESFLKEYPVKRIYNGIDTKIFKPTENRIKEKYHCMDKKLILGVASVWDERKGLQDFIQLADKVKEKYQIILIGLDKQQLKSLPEGVIGLQKTENIKTLVGFYSAADVFVNLTKEDNYPTTNLEAIACKTPVITYKTGGSVESAEMFGVSVTKGDLNQVVAALERVEKSECKDFALDCEETTKEYLALYPEINE